MPWWKPSAEQQGSRARDHLANERTFLAWLRTSAAAIALGVAIDQIAEQNSPRERTVAALFVVWGLVILLVSLGRYVQVMRDLDEGRFLPAVWGPIVMTGLGILLAAGSLLLVL